MLRKALFLLSGNAAAALFTLARNLVLARLIPVEDYGIAATFAVTMAVVEMASALGLQHQIVQAKDGDDPRFQAALQGFQLLRGVLSALLLVALAHPLAAFLGIPQVAWAYQVLAVMPVLNALVHFDVYRLQRRMSFGPGLVTTTVPATLSLALIWPLVAWFGDWQALLWAIIAQGVATAVLSHIVAERPYRLVLDRSIMARNLRFGWPLLANAVLLFLVFNGEKLIVGRELGMEALGIFAMGVTLTLTPTLVLAKTTTGFYLPGLSAADRNTLSGESEFQRRATRAFAVHILFGTGLVVVAMAFGAPFVRLILGDKFLPLIPLLTLMAVMQALRVFKVGPSIIGFARGRAENALVANLARAALLPVAWVVAARGGSIEVIILLGILGEIAGFIVAMWLVRRRARVALRSLVLPIGLSAVLLAVAGMASWGVIGQAWGLAICVGLFAGLLLAVRLGWSSKHGQ